MKIKWLSQIGASLQDSVFWIDAGLSNDHNFLSWTDPVFDAKLAEAMHSSRECVFFGKDNLEYVWSAELPLKYFLENVIPEYHIIGGLFGGPWQSLQVLCERFMERLDVCLQNEKDI